MTAASLVTRLARQGWWGQIIGPHGTGKSTLVATLLPELRAAGREPLLKTLHDCHVPPFALSARTLGLHPTAIAVLDGYEQLSIWQRWRLRRACRQAGCGLLITAHSPIGLPDLYKTAITTDLAQRVLAWLNRDRPARVNTDELTARLIIRRGDLRESLFDLYDLHEQRRLSSG
ncbi:MAG: hypothetical protein EXS05_22380 [Planctomycetaceae bacterium]|nr:hypothetical protein [Planctomycetaceae bacterium]